MNCNLILNYDTGGVCRLLKAQYLRNSLNNFTRNGSYGATAVLVIYELAD